MTDELSDILADFMPQQAGAKEAAQLIREGDGAEFLPDLVRTLTGHPCEVEEATSLWSHILEHAHELQASLGRPAGLRVAALDYFSNVLGKPSRPAPAHAELIENLYQQATKDALTDLANRRFFKARLQNEIARARRYATPFVEFLFDIDDFKSINDRRGHAEGDRILRDVASAIRASVRESDVVARWGGEEFAVLMPETPKEGGAILARRIRELVEKQLNRDGVTISGGVACFPDDAQDEETLFEFADRALYRAKAEGKNRVSLSPLERRAHPRHPNHYPIRVTSADAEDWHLESETADVSPHGVGLRHDGIVRAADEVKGVIQVQQETAPFRGRIVHVDEFGPQEYGVGIQFTEIAPTAQALLDDHAPATDA